MANQIGNESIPSGITWPTETDYIQGVASSLVSVSDLSYLPIDRGGLLTPPVMQQVAAVKMFIEGASDLPISQIVNLGSGIADIVSASRASDVVIGIGHLVSVGVDLAVTGIDLAVSSGVMAAEAAGQALEIVPLIGAMVGMVVKGIAAAMASDELRQAENQAAWEDCQRVAYGNQNTICSDLMRRGTVSPTGRGGSLVPADMFRWLVYAKQKPYSDHSLLPLNVASLYVMLCAAPAFRESTMEGWPLLIPNATELQAIISGHAIQTGRRNVGIPLDIQVRMWELIKGITSCVRHPGVNAPLMPRGSEGTELFPVLNDIILRLYESGADGGGPHVDGLGIDDELLSKLSSYVMNRSSHSTQCSNGRVITLNCSDIGIDLTYQFKQLLRTHKWDMRDRFDYSSGTWNLAPKKFYSRAPGVLVVSREIAEETAMAAQAAKDAAGAPRRRQIIGWTSAVVGAGSLFLASRLAKRTARGRDVL